MEKISVKINHKELLVNFWESNLENPLGIFYIHHGMAEHIERYDYFAEYLNSYGLHVVGHDHLGHGSNKENGQGIFAKTNGWDMACNEAIAVTDHFYNLFPDIPSYILGHSMGAFLAISTLKKIKNLKGVILTGTFLPSKIQLLLIKVLLFIERRIFQINENSKVHNMNFQGLNAFFKNPRTNFDWLAQDNSVVDKYIEDRNCGFNCSNSLWSDFIYGGELVLRQKTYEGIDINTEILIACGSDDPCIVNGMGIDGLYSFLKKKFNNVNLHKFHNMRHEIQNEPCKKELLSLIGGLIKK